MASLTWNNAAKAFEVVPPSGSVSHDIYVRNDGSPDWLHVYSGTDTHVPVNLTKGKKKGKGTSMPGGNIFSEIDFVVS